MPTDPTTQNPPVNHAEIPLRSQFADDPDMREIVDIFVTEMPSRIEMLERVWREQQTEELKRLAHQLKGASGGYGFPAVCLVAAQLEQTLQTLGQGGSNGPGGVDSLRRQFEELLSMCKRVTG